MAGYGICIFELEGIVVLVFPHSFVSLLLGRDVGIVLIDTLIEHIGLLIGEGGTF